MSQVRVGDDVSWKWASGIAKGKVIDVTPDTVVITTKGTKVTRNGTADNPAVTIENAAGTKILKLESELNS